MDSFNNETFSVISLRDVVNTLFRHKFKVIIIFLVCTVASLAYVLTLPDIYVSEAKLLVKMGRESVDMIPTADSERAVSLARSPLQDIYAELEILRNPNIYEQLYSDLDIESSILENNPEMMADISPQEMKASVVNDLMGSIYIGQSRSNSNIIVISYGNASPDFAHSVISNMIDIYLDKRADIHYSSGSYNFFNEQAKKYEDALESIEKRLADIKSELNINSVNEYRTGLMNRLESNLTELDMNNASIAEAESQIEEMKRGMSLSPETTPSGGILSDTVFEELLALQIKERELLAQYTDENVQVRDIHAQVTELRGQIRSASGTSIAPQSSQQMQQEIVTRQIDLVGLKARNQEITRMSANTRADLTKLNEVELQINQLERERQIQHDNYMKYADNLEEARIDEIVQKDKLSNIRILQPATEPLMPIEQRKFRDLVLGMFLGLMGGCGIALALDYMNHTIKTPEDVEKHLRLKTLTSIPKTKKLHKNEISAHSLLTDGNR